MIALDQLKTSLGMTTFWHHYQFKLNITRERILPSSIKSFENNWFDLVKTKYVIKELDAFIYWDVGLKVKLYTQVWKANFPTTAGCEK